MTTLSADFAERTLSNGLRVFVEPMKHTRSVAAGFLVRTGARDEQPELAGVSHFLEHMCFKGTPRRNWRQLNIDFDNLGSTYNAYTSKERTFYYGWVRDSDLFAQVDIIADMMRSILPPDEFATEKKVILEEIAMSEDQIDRHVYELMHEKLFAGHSLAWPVLGTQATVGAMTRDQMKAYFDDRYHPANMALIIAGNVTPEQAFDVAERLSADWQGRSPRPPRVAPTLKCEGAASWKLDRFQQQAIARLYPAPSALSTNRENADIAAAILGGHNSRFFWNIVQAGIAPNLWAGRIDYCDTGLMVLCGFCEPARVEELDAAMRREADKLMQNGVTEDELERVKIRSRTALATEAEAPYYRLNQMVSDIDDFDRPRSVIERMAAIEKVTTKSIGEYLAEWPINGKGFLCTVGPREQPIKS